MIRLSEIQANCIRYIESKDFLCYDRFDAMTNPALDRLSRGSDMLRRVITQINAISPVDLHWTGMKKMQHTKMVSDLLWYYAISNAPSKKEKIAHYFDWLLRIRSKKGYGWGLNFPYTSRFINADKDMPNLYNTVNSNIAICYAYEFLSPTDQKLALEVFDGAIHFLDNQLGFIDEGDRGWYRYYPGQTSPTYNVNALALYFLAFLRKLNIAGWERTKAQVDKIISLLVKEQEEDGSWYYSRSEKGKWIDGFHSAFVIESVAFACKNGYDSPEVKKCLEKGWNFYINRMFAEGGYPRYYLKSGKYPVEAQNMAQAIQTLSVFGLWMGWEQSDLLQQNIANAVNNLYDKRGFFYHRKTKYWTYKQPYFRWSVTPMIVGFEYAKQFLKTDTI